MTSNEGITGRSMSTQIQVSSVMTELGLQNTSHKASRKTHQEPERHRLIDQINLVRERTLSVARHIKGAAREPLK